MIDLNQPVIKSTPSTLTVKLAETDKEREQAFHLRYRVFAEESNNTQLMNPMKTEWDAFDQYCDHLIVKDMQQDSVVGTYRLLPGKRIANHGGFYSEKEFDLTPLKEHKEDILELGRSCIDPKYRSGQTLQLLWEGIATYLTQNPYRYMIGCASIHLEKVCEVYQIYSYFKKTGMLSEEFQINPHPSHRLQGLTEVQLYLSEKEIIRKLPPLLKGYRRMGAKIGGEPAYDPIFDSIDFLIILEKSRITQKYQRRFL